MLQILYVYIIYIINFKKHNKAVIKHVVKCQYYDWFEKASVCLLQIIYFHHIYFILLFIILTF